MYTRSQNENGTFNTMCLDCLRTIATSVESEIELEHLEMHHMCPEKALAQLLAADKVADTQAKRH